MTNRAQSDRMWAAYPWQDVPLFVKIDCHAECDSIAVRPPQLLPPVGDLNTGMPFDPVILPGHTWGWGHQFWRVYYGDNDQRVQRSFALIRLASKLVDFICRNCQAK